MILLCKRESQSLSCLHVYLQNAPDTVKKGEFGKEKVPRPQKLCFLNVIIYWEASDTEQAGERLLFASFSLSSEKRWEN